MTLQERVKAHLEQLSPHIKTRESATLLALCLGEMKLLEHENEQLSNMMGKLTDKNLESALTIERMEKENKRNAPTDNGITELDTICEQYNKRDISISQLICTVWNTACAMSNKGINKGTGSTP